jgi:hypothetical protein
MALDEARRDKARRKRTCGAKPERPGFALWADYSNLKV